MSKNSNSSFNLNQTKNQTTAQIAIVGTGPSGIYCALQLIEEF